MPIIESFIGRIDQIFSVCFFGRKTEASKISVLLTLLPSKPLLVVRLRSTLMDNLTQNAAWANNFKVWWGMSAHKRLEFIVY